jgi:hypothetical protein
LKNTMGRLAGAVLACALITLTVAPAASAQETNPTPTSEVTETSAPSESPTPTPTSSSVPDPTPSEPPVVTTPPSPTTSKPPVDPTPTSTSKPTETPDPTDPTEPTEPPVEPLEDGLVYGIDFGDGEGVLVISCAAAAPTNVTSPDFEITDGPFQDEVDGRVWGYGIKLRSGAVVDGENTRVSFTCDGKQYSNVPVPPAGGTGGGGVAPEKKTEKAQVKYAPKGGVATGFGGTAQA